MTAGGTGAASDWRRWRAPVILVGLILAGGVVVAMLQARPAVTGPLDPQDVSPAGTHALAALLAGQGRPVIRVVTAGQALAQSQRQGTALVITDPGALGPTSLAMLATSPADLLIVSPGRNALNALAPGVTLAARASAPVASLPPRCGLPAARLAGPADMGGVALRTTVWGAWRCYRASLLPARRGAAGAAEPGSAFLVRIRSDGRAVTVLGTAAPLTNAGLGRNGNAALALDLLGTDSRVIWLVPPPATAGGSSPASLIPGPVYLVVAELGVALVLAAFWRGRRFGPLVFEPMPVVVRASETVAGHGRLYRSRRARGRAAAALRTAALTRITARIGLPKEASPEATCQELASRTGRGVNDLHAMLYGPPPGDDAALVTLATDLDSLEGQVLTQ
ncbi:MAG TPA: DUF4350 domain-containing protein [Actinobacteria bacterium]|nr:DUF4350 domain-containing protein [Actinomycetota bacterium]